MRMVGEVRADHDSQWAVTKQSAGAHTPTPGEDHLVPLGATGVGIGDTGTLPPPPPLPGGCGPTQIRTRPPGARYAPGHGACASTTLTSSRWPGRSARSTASKRASNATS